MGGPCIIIQKEIICIKLQVQNKISDLTVKKIDYLRIKSNINIVGKISGCRYEQFSADSPDQALARLPARIGNSGESDLKSMVLRGGRGWHVLTNLKNLKLKKIKNKILLVLGYFCILISCNASPGSSKISRTEQCMVSSAGNTAVIATEI